MPALHGRAGRALTVLSSLWDSFSDNFFKLHFAIKRSTLRDLHGQQVQLFQFYLSYRIHLFIFAIKGSTGSDLHGRQAKLFSFLGISVFLIFEITILYCEINIPGLTYMGTRSSVFCLFLIKDTYKISSNTLLWLGCWGAFLLGGAAAGLGSRFFGFGFFC